MNEILETYGFARLGDNFRAARLENDGTRIKVLSLANFDEISGHKIPPDSRFFFNVNDRAAIVKRISIRKSTPVESSELVRFEMAQSLLEPAESYYFEALPIDDQNGDRRFLSIAYHRREIDQQINHYSETIGKPSGFKLDAVALARGYLAFCRIPSGDLQILANIESCGTVLAFLYKKKLCSVAKLDQSPNQDMEKPETVVRLAKELKMTISYNLSELFQEGITVPPSLIIVSGHLADDMQLKTTLSEIINTEIEAPRFHEGYFEKTSEETIEAEKEHFLIPLGLAVS